MKLAHLMLALVLAAGVVLAMSASAQSEAGTDAKTIHVLPRLLHDPVEIVRVMKGATEIKPGAPFEAGDDWLKEVSVVVRNVSGSKIVFLGIDANLPETGAGTYRDPRIPAGNVAGRRPEPATYSPLTGLRRQEDNEHPAQPIELEPGEELVVPIIASMDYDKIKSLITAKLALSSVRDCNVSVTTVYFSDGTKWSPGSYWRPDKGKLGKYVPVSFEEWLEMSRTASGIRAGSTRWGNPLATTSIERHTTFSLSGKHGMGLVGSTIRR